MGVKWCVLTNGDEYRIYNSHAEVDVEEKLFRKVSLSASDSKILLDTIALLSKDKMRGSLLDELWKAHFIDRKVRLAFESLLREDDAALIRYICKKASGVTPSEARASLKRAKITIDFPVPKVPEQPETPAPPRESMGPAAGARSTGVEPAIPGATLADLIKEGLVIPPLPLERTYKGVKLTATVEADGRVSFGGQAYDSPSTAGGMARKSVIGAPEGHPYPQTNGWTFWQFHDPKSGDRRQLELPADDN